MGIEISMNLWILWLFSVALMGALSGCSDDESAPYHKEWNRDSGRSPYMGDADNQAASDASSGKGSDGSALDPLWLENQILEQNKFTLDVSEVESFVDQRSFSLSAGDISFALTYQSYEQNADCPIQIETLVIPSYGSVQQARLAFEDDSSTCPAIRDLAVGFQDPSWQLFWSDDRTSVFNLYRMGLDSTQGPIPINSADQAQTDAVVARVDTNLLMAWISERVTETGQTRRSIKTLLIDGEENQEQVVVEEQEGHNPTHLILSPVLNTSAVLGWVDNGESHPGVFVLPLHRDGLPLEAPDQLSSYPAQSMDIATGDNGHVAVYSIRVGGTKQIRIQRLNGIGGKPEAKDERKVVISPEQGGDASIVWWGGYEFMIAYRVYIDNTITSPMLRLMSVDLGTHWSPDSISKWDIAPASTSGGQVSLSRALDGTLMVAWLDIKAVDQKELKAFRIQL